MTSRRTDAASAAAAPAAGQTPHIAEAVVPVLRTGHGAAHAKSILLGEHAVVYGAPAIAIPIHELETIATVTAATGRGTLDSDLYTGPLDAAPERLRPVLTALLAASARIRGAEPDDRGTPIDPRLIPAVDLQIRSTIPHERGLGSSAAVAAAIARAVHDAAERPLDSDALFSLIQTSERAAHGNPSGIDARTVTSPVPIRFDRGEAVPITLGAPLILTVADSGSSGSTTQAVGGVRARREQAPRETDALLNRLAQIAEGAIADLESGAVESVGARMREAHGILHRVGVSSDRLDAIVDAAHRAESPGAKLTGGGLGGCVIAVARDTAHADALGHAMRRAGAQHTWTVEVPAE